MAHKRVGSKFKVDAFDILDQLERNKKDIKGLGTSLSESSLVEITFPELPKAIFYLKSYKNSRGVVSFMTDYATSRSKKAPFSNATTMRYFDRLSPALAQIEKDAGVVAESLSYSQKKKDDKKEQRSKGMEKLQLEVGQVYYTSWGHEQTNVDFFKVLEIKPSSAKLVAIDSKSVTSQANLNNVIPNVNKIVGTPFTARIVNIDQAGFPTFKVDGHYAWVWKGKPVYETAQGRGH